MAPRIRPAPVAVPGGPTVFQDPSGQWKMGFGAWTQPSIGYVVVGDLRYTRSLHILPITFPGGGHNPRVG
jgi:hypothetical protein